MFLMGGESTNGARLGIIADIWERPLGLLCGSWLSSINILKKRRHLETPCPVIEAIDPHWQNESPRWRFIEWMLCKVH